MMKDTIHRVQSNFIRLVAHQTVESSERVIQELKKIEANGILSLIAGGEGIVLRNPKAFYEGKRSWDSLKVKSYSDQEVQIMKAERENEENTVYTVQGSKFAFCIKAKNNERGGGRASYKPGDRILIRYTRCDGNGIPKNPTIMRQIKL